MSRDRSSRVVVIGAGFAGWQAVQTLSQAGLEVLWIDQHNYQTFSPLLHQVATAELEPHQIAYPIRRRIRRLPTVQFSLTQVQHIDVVNRVIETHCALISYDYLVVAAGSMAHLQGVPGIADYAFPLKTLPHAIALRNHLLLCLERANQSANAQRRQQLLTFTIVGGGPTGIELASSLAELMHTVIPRDFPGISLAEVRIGLVHGGDRLLNSFSPSLSRYAQRQLARLGVETFLKQRVVAVTPTTAQLSDGSSIASETVVWAGGVRGSSRAEQWGLPVNAQGRVWVDQTLALPQASNVYVVGDLADVAGQALPMLAQAAMQSGKAAAQNIVRQVRGQRLQPFRYQHLGMLAVVGRYGAIAQLGAVGLTGLPAWLLWMGVHWWTLAGWRDRLLVLLNWLWNAVTRDRVARILLTPSSVPQSITHAATHTATHAAPPVEQPRQFSE